MAKGVFISKVSPGYDDIPEWRYQFPQTYLRKAQEMVGDWIIYYESRRDGGRQAYFATARVREIRPDPDNEGRYYAFVEDYLEFPSPVPFREGDQFYEGALRNTDGSVNLGLFQRAIHLLPEPEYAMILQRGTAPAPAVLPESEPVMSREAEPEADFARPIVTQLTNRKFRDSAFERVVRSAYDSTCAMTGIRLINGGGRCEIEAAHIRSVADHGPDSPRNGIALSRTVHWAFDRGIVSLQDDGKILTADKLLPEPVKRMLHPDGYIRKPEMTLWQPHPQFLRYHREHVFKG